MRVLIHDYSGHPFQVQLTRELARRGHEARHIFSASFQTPKGNLAKSVSDPDTFSIVPVSLEEEFAKDSFLKRRRQEIEQGRMVAQHIEVFAPDIIVSSNAPLDTQRQIWATCRRLGIPKVFWVQDIYSEAILRILSRKLSLPGRLIGQFYQKIETRLLQQSQHIVAISEDFLPVLRQMGATDPEITVVENWAPLEDLTPHRRDNDWAAKHLTSDRPRFIYSGTLGKKHNPEHLLALAEAIPEADVLIFSEGAAVDELRQKSAQKGLQNLLLRPWVAFEDLPKMLSSADVLVVLLEEEAGVFSVPSKILTYCTIGRAILGSIPAANLGGQILGRNQIGLTSAPSDQAGFTANAKALLADAKTRSQMGHNGRAYAERTFDISTIADRFETLLKGSMRKGQPV